MPRSLVWLLVPVFLLSPARAEENEKAKGKKAVTAEAFFTGGKVEKFKARRIALRYDLSDAKALGDFAEANPFLTPPSGGFTIAGGALKARGVGALVHKGVFEADVGVEMTLTSKKPQDIGVVLLEPGVTERFLLYALADTFFSTHDRQPTHQHMVTMVGAKDEGPEGSQFRYLNRTREPRLKAGKPIEVQVLKRGKRNRFYFAGTTMDAEDRDRYGTLDEVQPGLFVLKSEMTVTKLRITGKLTKAWLEKVGISYDPKEKDDEAVKEFKPPKGNVVPVPDPNDRGGGGGGRSGWPGGRSGALGLVGKIRDTKLSEKERKEAAKGLTKENVKLNELRALIDCLYSDDLLTRTLAIQVLSKVTGKTLGYHPKAPANARKKAIRSWGRYLMENRDKFR
ncbi:MAG: hypothetical protein ACYS99_01690 [Planctomycetota bacterium]|jgi:hypothetical protein